MSFNVSFFFVPWVNKEKQFQILNKPCNKIFILFVYLKFYFVTCNSQIFVYIIYKFYFLFERWLRNKKIQIEAFMIWHRLELFQKSNIFLSWTKIVDFGGFWAESNLTLISRLTRTKKVGPPSRVYSFGFLWPIVNFGGWRKRSRPKIWNWVTL